MNANMNMYIYISIHEPVIFQGVVNDFWILSTSRVESLNLRRIQAIRRWQSLASWSRFCKNANMINNWNSHVISSPKHHHFFWNKWNFIFLQNHGLRSQSSIFPVILSPVHLWSFLGNDIKLSWSSDHHKFNKDTKNDALETSKKLCFGNQKWKITKKPHIVSPIYLQWFFWCIWSKIPFVKARPRSGGGPSSQQTNVSSNMGSNFVRTYHQSG